MNTICDPNLMQILYFYGGIRDIEGEGEILDPHVRI